MVKRWVKVAGLEQSRQKVMQCCNTAAGAPLSHTLGRTAAVLQHCMTFCLLCSSPATLGRTAAVLPQILQKPLPSSLTGEAKPLRLMHTVQRRLEQGVMHDQQRCAGALYN